MNLMERAKAGQLSDFELSKLRELVILYINNDAADNAIQGLPEGIDDYHQFHERVATRQYKFLSMGTAIKKTGLSRSTIERMEKEGTFPKRVTLSDSRKGWHSHDVHLWMETRCIVEDINTDPEYREEDRKEGLKFCNIVRLYGLRQAVDYVKNQPGFPHYDYEDDEDEQE